MPCTAPVRGKTDQLVQWSDWIDNDPCGKPDYADGLCKPHWQARYGLVPAGDPTLLLLHGETLTDSSSYARPITAGGGAAPSAAQSKFGGSSVLLNGTSGYLSAPDSPDFAFGAGDFTIEGWIYFTSVATGLQTFASQWTSPPQYSWILRLDGNPITTAVFYYSLDGTNLLSLGNSFVPTAGQWYHVAIVRSGSNLLMFTNGVQMGTTQALTGALFDSSVPLGIGAKSDFLGWFLSAYLDEFRISRVARWTAPFTPPAAPY